MGGGKHVVNRFGIAHLLALQKDQNYDDDDDNDDDDDGGDDDDDDATMMMLTEDDHGDG